MVGLLLSPLPHSHFPTLRAVAACSLLGGNRPDTGRLCSPSRAVIGKVRK